MRDSRSTCAFSKSTSSKHVWLTNSLTNFRTDTCSSPSDPTRALTPAAVAPAPGIQGTALERQALMEKLFQLSPEQIDRLPDHLKVQVLQVLHSNS